MILLSCLVHPIDVKAHPTQPPGFRWAVMVGVGPDDDLDRCVNAGWCPTRQSAEAEGDQNAATAARVLQLAGLPGRYGGVRHTDHDPIPAGRDRVNILGG